jgi:chitin disaccharide deacetylase
MKVIINADDLGINRAVNARVFGFMSARQLTSATILINAPEAEAAVAESFRHPNCSFGIHLNVTEFKPLTSNGALKPILNRNGEFAGKEVLRRTPVTNSLREAILDEWSAQVEKARSLGLRISHLDSHHYAHTIPSLFLALKGLQRRYELRKVRNTQNIYAGSRPSWIFFAKKKYWTWALRHWYPTTTTDAFTLFSVFYSWMKDRCRVPYSSVELMTHPGSPAYEEETELLTSNWQALAPFAVTLINYNEL